MFETLGICMRWLHIASVATLIGGMIYGCKALYERTAALFRPLVFGAIAALLVSGGYTLATNPGHNISYYVLLGIKLLLVAHVFAVGILLVTKNPEHRGRLLAGSAISGLIIILISAYLRRNF
jgi:hypothetical protein